MQQKAVNRPRSTARPAGEAARTPSVQRQTDTTRNEGQNKNSTAPLPLDRGSPRSLLDGFRRLQPKKEIILQQSLSFAMLAGNGRSSGTEVSHNFVVTYMMAVTVISAKPHLEYVAFSQPQVESTNNNEVAYHRRSGLRGDVACDGKLFASPSHKTGPGLSRKASLNHSVQ
jgi:hypothetical protein